MTKTPEDYLICHNVPIARTGWYTYLGQELGMDEYYNEPIEVYRGEEEVFSQASIASFEGKPTTDEHPTTDVRPDNYSSILKGIATNVRRGAGENIDCLVADLIIYDPILQSEIEAGKREISCGYECVYEPLEEPNKYQQRQIRGNHIAVVTNGRAGSRVAIKDESPILKNERRIDMGNQKSPSLFAKMFAAFAKDAEPEEIAKAVDEMGTKEEAKDEEPDITGRLAKIEEILSKLVKSDEEVHAELPKDEMTELENELSKDVNGEESATISPEEIKDEEPEEEKKNSNDSLLTTVRAMKPIIAAMKDPTERKKATDALIKSVRGQMTVKDNDASKLVKIMNDNAKARDSKMVDNTDFGKKCAERNPHFKGGK